MINGKPGIGRAVDAGDGKRNDTVLRAEGAAIFRKNVVGITGRGVCKGIKTSKR